MRSSPVLREGHRGDRLLKHSRMWSIGSPIGEDATEQIQDP